MKYEAIFFDLDGTLVDSSLDIAISVNYIRQSLGKDPLPNELVQSFVGDGVQKLFERALETKDQDAINHAVSLWRPHYENACMVHTYLFDGFRELLADLSSRGIPMAVITNKPRKPAVVILDGFGISRYFKGIVGGDCTPTRKPEPEMFERAMELTQTKGRKILHVGDGKQDIQGAKRLGLATCGVTWGYGGDEDLAGADIIVDRVDELYGVFGIA